MLISAYIIKCTYPCGPLSPPFLHEVLAQPLHSVRRGPSSPFLKNSYWGLKVINCVRGHLLVKKIAQKLPSHLKKMYAKYLRFFRPPLCACNHH